MLELLYLVKQTSGFWFLPLATFSFSRCSAALQLLRQCTNALGAGGPTICYSS